MKFKTIKEFNEENNNWELMFFDGLGYSKEDTMFLMNEIDTKITSMTEANVNCYQQFTVVRETSIFDIYMIQQKSFVMNKRGSPFAILCIIPLGYVKNIPICEESIEDDLSGFRGLNMEPYSYHSFLLYSVMGGVGVNNRLSRLYSYQDKNDRHLIKIFETEVIKYKDYEDRDFYIAKIQYNVINIKKKTPSKTGSTYLVLRPYQDSKIIKEIENEAAYVAV